MARGISPAARAESADDVNSSKVGEEFWAVDEVGTNDNTMKVRTQKTFNPDRLMRAFPHARVWIGGSVMSIKLRVATRCECREDNDITLIVRGKRRGM